MHRKTRYKTIAILMAAMMMFSTCQPMTGYADESGQPDFVEETIETQEDLAGSLPGDQTESQVEEVSGESLEPLPEISTEPLTELITEAPGELPADPAAEPVDESLTEPVTESPAEPLAGLNTDISGSSAEKPVTEPPVEPATDLITESPTEKMEPVETEPAETEPETTDMELYSGYWLCTGVDEGNGTLVTANEDGIAVADLMLLQLGVYEDGSILVLTTDMEASGKWEETPDGIAMVLQSYGQMTFELEAVYEDGFLMLKDGPGTYRMERMAEKAEKDDVPIRTAETLHIPFGGDGYTPESDALSLGFDPNYYPVSLISGDVNVLESGEYTVTYGITDPVINKVFRVIRPVVVEEKPEPETGLEDGSGLKEAAESDTTENMSDQSETSIPDVQEGLTKGMQEETEEMTEAPGTALEPSTELITEAHAEPDTEDIETETQADIVEPGSEAGEEPQEDHRANEAGAEEPGEPDSEAVTERMAEPDKETGIEQITEPDTEAVTEPMTEPDSEPVTGPETGPDTESEMTTDSLEPETEASSEKEEIKLPVKSREQRVEAKAETGSITVKIQDAMTSTGQPVNAHYSMEGAEYTLYTDSECMESVDAGEVKDGKKVFESLPLGEYFLKETKAPVLYDPDEEIYAVALTEENADQTVISPNQPKRAQLKIQAVDAETGKTEPYTKALSFEGVSYGIYKDSACTELAEEVTADEGGSAVLALLIDNYYVKATKAPAGYLLSEEIAYVRQEEIQAAIRDGEGLEAKAKQQIIRGDLLLNHKSGEDLAEPEGIFYTLTYVSDPAITFDVCGEKNTILTDREGNAYTEQKDIYPRGTLIYGLWRVSQPQQPGIQETIRDFEFEITEDGLVYPYTVSNTLVQARVEIRMEDEETGSQIPVEGAEFRITDRTGKAVTMWNPASGKYQDTFQTGADGTLRLPNTLSYGSYTLEETRAPEGYLLAGPVAVEVKENLTDPLSPLVITCSHRPQMGTVALKMKDTDTNQSAGAGFTYQVIAAEDITDAAGQPRTGENAGGKKVSLIKGTVVAEITTDETGTAVTGGLYLGSYFLKEKTAAEYYALNESELPAELKAAPKKDAASLEITAENTKTLVEVSKVDAYDHLKPLPGITFRIFTDAEADAGRIREYNSRMEEFSNSQQAALKEMQDRQEEEYQKLLDTQQESLDSYREGHNEEELEAFSATQEKTLEQAQGEALKEQEAFIERQEDTLQTFVSDIQESVRLGELGQEYMTDKDGMIRMSSLKHDTTYYVVETKTLPGYSLDPKIYEINVDEDGLIDGKGKYFLALGNVPNTVQLSVKDESQQELPGAQMALLDDKGSEIHTWTTGTEPYGILGLAAGTYTLKMIAAPGGYAIAEPITFTTVDQQAVQSVSVNCEKLRIRITLIDTDSGQPVKGSKLLLRAEDGRKVSEWTSDGTPHVLTVNAGSYILSETETPAGYATAEPVEIRVNSENSLKEVEMLKKPLSLVIHMKDGQDGSERELSGAVLSLVNEKGKEIEAWTTAEDAHVIKYLPVGTYTLKQLSVPAGYRLGESLTFTIQDTEKEQSVKMTGVKTAVEIYLTDAAAIPLLGAELIVTDTAGTEVDRWITDENNHTLAGLPAGTYILKQITAPAGYVTAKDISFTVTNAPETVQVKMTNMETRIGISRTDANGQPLAGAELVLKDSDGKEIRTWTSAEEAYSLTGLPVGTYTLEELTAPAGYSRADAVAVTVKNTDVQQSAVITSAKTIVEICKKAQADLSGLSGAKLTVMDDNGENKESWVTDGKPHRIEGLPVGNYFLVEEAAPNGYSRAASVPFTVTDSQGVQTVEIYGEPTRIAVSLVNTEKELLSGAELTVTDANGEVKESWMTGDAAHELYGLPVGTYTLTETKAPSGYAVSGSITFAVTDSREIQKVEMQGTWIKVSIVKKSSEDGSVLAGAKLTLKDQKGDEVQSWTSGKEPQIITGLATGTYTLEEITAPSGYATEKSIAVTVTDSREIQTVEFPGTPTKAEISIKEADTEKELSGAALEIRDAKGKVVDKWTSDGKPHTVTKLAFGNYTLKETGAPSGYVISKTVRFTITDTKDLHSVNFYNPATQAEISLLDEDGQPLAGASMMIKDSAGKEIQKWTSGEEAEVIRKLPKGKYILTELTAPEGYARAESVSLRVTDTTVKASMKNKPVKIEICKKDLTNSRMLSGAKLAIQDSKGRTLEEWATDEKPHKMEKLAVGDYVLVEKSAPRGYELTGQMYFTVEDKEELQTFTMYNKPKEGTTSLVGKKTGTTASLTGSTSLTGSLTGTTLKGTTSLNGSSKQNLTADPVKTGDNTPLLRYLLVFAGASVILVLLIFKKRRVKNNRKQ